MKDILVSICCITYNHKNYIEDALESFLMQKTNFKFEILIHDDCSTDGTQDIIKKYQKKYPEIIKPIFQKENKYSNGVKRIMYIYNDRRAKGKYIALCEGDDYWIDSYKLQKQVNYLEENPQCSMCFHGAKILDVNKNIVVDMVQPYNKSCISEIDDIIIKGGGFCPTASIMYPKKYTEEMPSFFMDAHVGDYPLQMILASKGKVYYFNELMSVYRVGDKNSWTNTIMNGYNKKQKIISNINNDIVLLNEFNRYSNFKYSKIIDKAILMNNINRIYIEGNLKELKKEYYKEYFNSISLKGKMCVYADCYCPNLYKSLIKIRNTVRKKLTLIKESRK